MQETDTITIHELVNDVVQANQRIAHNYCFNFGGYHRDLHDMSLAYSYLFTKVFSEPSEFYKLNLLFFEFLQGQQKLLQDISKQNNLDKAYENLISPHKEDKRFSSALWDRNPYFNFLKQNYWLLSQFSEKMIEEIEMAEAARKKLRFYTRQYVSMLSPSNFFFTNPEVMQLTLKTGGENLLHGLKNLVEDVKQGRISQVEDAAFTVGKDLATTPGSVVFENEIMQVIQYAPATKDVFYAPILLIPPWINKFYILDLRPENSLVKYLVEKGFSVFVISWRNPSPGMGHLSFEDYVSDGALKAIEVAKEISGSEKINVLGYCLGGTLTAVACSILAARKRDLINTITFLGAMVDFSYIGPMGDVINEALVRKLEQGELLRDGVLHGHDMERAFNLIRANDMIWNYAVKNYLKGETPPPIDVIYWTNDNTNLPSHMYLYYMRKMILENKLSRKNALRICNTPVDVGKIDCPVFVIGFKEDYISPPVTAFTTTELVSGPVEFILGGSGHVMGATNSPTSKKYGFYYNGKLGYGYKKWLNTARYQNGSWWSRWSERLGHYSGETVPAPKRIGSEGYKPIEPAPGRYVMERC